MVTVFSRPAPWHDISPSSLLDISFYKIIIFKQKGNEKSEISVTSKNCDFEDLNGVRRINFTITTNFDLIDTILDITILTGFVLI